MIEIDAQTDHIIIGKILSMPRDMFGTRGNNEYCHVIVNSNDFSVSCKDVKKLEEFRNKVENLLMEMNG